MTLTRVIIISVSLFIISYSTAKAASEPMSLEVPQSFIGKSVDDIKLWMLSKGNRFEYSKADHAVRDYFFTRSIGKTKRTVKFRALSDRSIKKMINVGLLNKNAVTLSGKIISVSYRFREKYPVDDYMVNTHIGMLYNSPLARLLPEKFKNNPIQIKAFCSNQCHDRLIQDTMDIILWSGQKKTVYFSGDITIYSPDCKKCTDKKSIHTFISVSCTAQSLSTFDEQELWLSDYRTSNGKILILD